ncbi:hypothetical protein ABIA36_000905 [Leifsonia sp. EB34]
MVAYNKPWLSVDQQVARLAELLSEFPSSEVLTVASLGVPEEWEFLELWSRCPTPPRRNTATAGTAAPLSGPARSA